MNANESTSPLTTLPVALALYALLAASQALLVPVFVPPDEISHVAHAAHLRTRGLPRVEQSGMGGAVETAIYPPLYPALMAPFTWGLDLADMRHTRALGLRNDWGPVHRRIVGMRLLTALTGALAVAFTYQLARRTSGPDTAFVAALLVGALPQFTFIAGAVSPEAPAAALVALGLLNLFDDHWLDRDGRWYVAAALIGLAGITRPQAVGAAAAIPVFAVLSRERFRVRFATVTIAMAVALAPILVWGLRNLGEYGQMFLLDTQASSLYEPSERRGAWIPYLDHCVRLFFPSFIGRFGHMDLPLPDGTVAIALAIWGAGLARGTWLAIRKPELRAGLGAALAAAAGVAAAVIVFYLSYDSPQGRHVFAALPALALAAATGLVHGWPDAVRRRLTVLVPLFFVALSAWALVVLEWPAYAR
jgi:4-amino-4-deoxy-L-arabinose transferase-like glycosyltransferase